MSGEHHTFQGNDGEFHYIDWGGSGPLLHLGHATGFCAGAYSPLAEMLTSRFRVLGLDDRGHGRTRAPADPARLHDWDVFARDLEAFWESLGEPVIAAGHSRAGAAALTAAVRRPELVRALVLIDPTMLPPSWMWWWFLLKKAGLSRLAPIAHRASRRRNRWPDRRAVLESYQGKGPFPAWRPGFLEAYVREGTRTRPDGRVELCCHPDWEARCFAVCPHDVWALPPLLKRPCLVIYGENSDTFLPPAVRRLARDAPGALIRPLAGASHFAPMERPEECRDLIVEFSRGL